MENHHHNSIFSRLFPSSCHFDSIAADVVESSIITKYPKNIHKNKSFYLNTQKIPPNSKHFVTATKQSSSSNSGLFSTEDEKERAISKITKIQNNDKLYDDFFSLSSDSSLSSFRNIGILGCELGISSRKRGKIAVKELAPSSSSEASTSSSINSYSPLKNQNPRKRVTLAERFNDQSPGFFSKNAEKDYLCLKSVNSGKTEKILPKTAKMEHISSTSSVFRPKTGETEHFCSKSSIIHRNLKIEKCPLFIKGLIEESYAVEKESRDPKEDFMESMVEMIVEKKISGSKDLDKLLLCFLSLNSPVYHKVILDVFSEVCEAIIGR